VTVGELVERLSALDPNRLAVLASDEEGNSFHEVRAINGLDYALDDDGGLAMIGPLTPELEEAGYTEEDLYDGDYAQPVVVLWP